MIREHLNKTSTENESPFTADLYESHVRITQRKIVEPTVLAKAPTGKSSQQTAVGFQYKEPQKANQSQQKNAALTSRQKSI